MKTIQDVKKEAREYFHKSSNTVPFAEIVDHIVELSAKAHEEATRIETKFENKIWNSAVKSIERKSKQFFEEV
jgi:hypothetical protein